MVQGSAAVGIKYGMIECAKQGLVRGRLAGQIHDELLSVVPKKEAKEYGHALEEAMLKGMDKILQGQFCKVETKIGETWQA
jgi:DNA polymerase I-like protein with 3'-5' exonuclease and polymerase domains